MTQLFTMSEAVKTSYSQVYLTSLNYREGELSVDAFKGQTNGLCGAAVPGGLFLGLGCWGGRVPFTVEVHDVAPPVDASWDEIVEASCRFEHLPVALTGCDGDCAYPLPLTTGEYRVRFCAKGYGESKQVGGFCDPAIESYLLILWPETQRADEVIKQTSAKAAHFHDEVRNR
ncbi:hypothetical protein [Massilia sp. TSP1-1-2]|uniref:hypothetical protein n=1 Tax=Massilia sp. TSP1-1-2 TaxID=2804649 RepID=UPI003CFAA2E8